MPAYVRVQDREFAREADGYTATKHQREAGTGYFDLVLQTVSGGQASTAALKGSTEAEQFHGSTPDAPAKQTDEAPDVASLLLREALSGEAAASAPPA